MPERSAFDLFGDDCGNSRMHGYCGLRKVFGPGSVF
jgi:hypothetical protein